MSYHPLMGITIFIIFLLLAFFLGRSKRNLINKQDIIKLKKKKVNADSISPDAHWLQSKDN